MGLHTSKIKELSRVIVSLTLVISLMFPGLALSQDSDAVNDNAQQDSSKDLEKIRKALEKLGAQERQQSTVPAPQLKTPAPADTAPPSVLPSKTSPGMMSKKATMMENMPKGRCMGKMCNMGMSDSRMMGMPPKPDDNPLSDNPLSDNPLNDNLNQTNVPHLFHIGESGFFLDYSEQLNLNNQQKVALSEIKQSWLAERERLIAQRKRFEQMLWQQTGNPNPNLLKISETVQKIAQANASLRLKFIVQVSDASRVLEGAQVNLLRQLSLQMEPAIQ